MEFYGSSILLDVPDDVSTAEIQQIEAVMWHMASWAPRLDADNESISDDDICTICYAYAKSVSFEPCHHRSCRYVYCALYYSRNYHLAALGVHYISNIFLIFQNMHSASFDEPRRMLLLQRHNPESNCRRRICYS